MKKDQKEGEAPTKTSGNDDSTPPKAKKQRTESSITRSCLILATSPEIPQKIRSFLALQDALSLRTTCRQFHTNGNDAFRYSCLLDLNTVKSRMSSVVDQGCYLGRQQKQFHRAF